MERIRQKQMKFIELTQPGWEDATDYFRDRDKKYGTSELRVPAVVHQRTNNDALPHPPATFAGLMERLDIVPGISEGTSRPGSSHIRLGSVKPQSKSSIPSGEPAAEPDSSPLLNAKPVEPVSFYPSMWPPANYDIVIGFRRRDGDGSCVCGRLDMQIISLDVWSQGKARCLPILLCVRFFLIWVTKLWDLIIRLCMCKGRTHHVQALESDSRCKTGKTFSFILQVTLEWWSKSNISDEMS